MIDKNMKTGKEINYSDLCKTLEEHIGNFNLEIISLDKQAKGYTKERNKRINTIKWLTVIKYYVASMPKREIVQRQLDIIDKSITEYEKRVSSVASWVKDLKDTEVKKLKKEYDQMQMNHAVTPLENPMLIRKTRRTVARLATELSKRDSQ